MKQYGFYVNSDHCMGCKACAVACKDRFDVQASTKRGANPRRYPWQDSVKRRKVSECRADGQREAYYISLGCNHCAQPPCIDACPTKAIHKRQDDGIVILDESKCLSSCFLCKEACPYGSPSYDYEAQHMRKCSFCTEETGLPDPSCVSACPLRVLEFGDMREMQMRYSKDDVSPALEPYPGYTVPSLVAKKSRHTKPDAKVVNQEEMDA